MKKLIFGALSLVAGLLASDYVDGLNAYKANDYQKAKELFEKACDSKNARACFNLGFLYSKGKGVSQDDQKASKLWQKACDGNDALACYNLGLLYKKGQGVKQNSQQAKTLFNKACYFGFQNACEYY